MTKSARWLVIDLGALACLLIAVAILIINLAQYRLGLISSGAVFSLQFAIFTVASVGIPLSSHLRGMRAFVHEREDRKIMVAAAAALIATGSIIGLLAVGVMGDHGREVITSKVKSASVALADALSSAITTQSIQVQIIADRLLPASNLLSLGDSVWNLPRGPHANSDAFIDAIVDLTPSEWAVRDLSGEIVLKSGKFTPNAPALPLRLGVPGHAWLVRDIKNSRFYLRLLLPIRTGGRLLGSFEATLPINTDRLIARLVQAMTRGEFFVCSSQQRPIRCLPGPRIGSLKNAEAAVRLARLDPHGDGVVTDDLKGRPRLTAYTPIGESGLGLALRVSGKDLFGSLLDAARQVSIVLPILVLLGLGLLAWQVRPVARRLHESEGRLRSAFDYSGLGVVMFARSGQIVLANAALAELLAFSESELLSMPDVVQLVHPEEQGLAIGMLAEAFSSGSNGAYCAQRRYRRKTGDYVSVRLHVSPVLTERGVADMAVAFVQDVSELQKKTEALGREHAFLRAILGQMSEGVVACNERGDLRYANETAMRQLGYTKPSGPPVQWRQMAGLHHPDMRPVTTEDHPLQLALQGKSVVRAELLAMPRHDERPLQLQVSSQPLQDDMGKPIGAVLVSHDLTEIKASHQRLEWLAYHDPLTGLPNRNLLVDRLQAAMTRVDQTGGMLAVLFLDLDRFKTVNESLGHSLGDQLLVEVSTRLRSVLDTADTLARLGGDDFAVLMEAVPDADSVAHATDRLLSVLTQPVLLDGHVLYTSASAGVALYPGDGDVLGLLLSRADAAMFQAKQATPGSWRFFNRADTQDVEKRIDMESALRTALDLEEFVLFFQPKVEVATSRITGAEALLRWNRPGAEPVQPAAFIPLLEDIGMIASVGAWAIKSVCKQQASWLTDGLPVVPIAVNCSARQFHGVSLVDLISGNLAACCLPAHLLEIEITESVLMREPELVSAALSELRSLGVESSIDDFGTGYSSLAYLKRLPVSTLKIDRAFIKDLPHDPDDAAITQAVLALANALGMKAVAEGVETEEQLAFLKRHHCDEYQGYYCSPPVPAHEFAAILRAQRMADANQE